MTGRRRTRVWRASAFFPPAVALTLALVFPGSEAAADDPGQDAAARLVAALAGEWRTRAGSLREGEEAIVDRRAPLPAPDGPGHALYLEVEMGPREGPYRQRVLVFTAGEKPGEVVQRAWRLREPGAWAGAWARAAALARLGPGDLEADLPPDCDVRWSETPTGWEALLDPAACRIFSERRQAWRRIGSQARLEGDTLRLAERGYDDAGEQVFGTPPGAWHVLERVR